MTQFSFSITRLSSLLLSDLLLFCSFILSHPLYFSYFIFFSPYLLKLISFLSPLFITTSLLLIALLTLSPTFVVDIQYPPHLESKASFLLTSYHAILNTLRSKLDDETNQEFHVFEDLEACIEVLEKSIFEVPGNPTVEFWQTKEQLHSFSETPHDIHVVDSPTYQTVSLPPKEVVPFVEENKFPTDCLQELPLPQTKCVLPDSIPKLQVIVTHANFTQWESMNTGCKEAGDKVTSIYDGEGYVPKAMESPKVLGSCGSMRKDKEWKRTLACKLYEERQFVDGVDGGEGMDLLWEAYEGETGSKKSTKATDNDNKEKVKKEKKREIEYFEEEEDAEEEMNTQLCCLQALKFSTRKMNLGMRKPSLVKISKALKGIGWFQQVSKHGKKGLN